MPTISKIIFDNEAFYQADDIKEISPASFKGCTSIRVIINKKNIPQDDYLYARYDAEDDSWDVTDGSSRKFDKLFISVSWAKDNIPELSKTAKHEVPMAPELIHLTKKEKFRDNDNNIIEIEVRGERDVEKCYFRVRDIQEGFNIPRLHDNILDKRYNGHQENIHYQFFNIKKRDGLEKIKIKKELYITFNGLIRILFASSSKTANKFTNWATKTLFVAQMGTADQKLQLVSDITGVPIKATKVIFDKSANVIPGIYLICLGKVEELRDILDIDDSYEDNDFVYKFGLSEDINRRSGEHQRKFKKMGINDIKLCTYSTIDPLNISKAETKLKKKFINYEMMLPHEEFTELAVIPMKKLKQIKDEYAQLGQLYAGHTAEMKQQINDLMNQLNNKNTELVHKEELHKLTLSNTQKDLQIANDQIAKLEKQLKKLKNKR